MPPFDHTDHTAFLNRCMSLSLSHLCQNCIRLSISGRVHTSVLLICLNKIFNIAYQRGSDACIRLKSNGLDVKMCGLATMWCVKHAYSIVLRVNGFSG